jgi:hypothetical protein
MLHLLLLVPNIQGNAIAGGAGYALAFDNFMAMTVSTVLDLETPPTAFTIEYWARTTDVHLTQQPVWAYSVYSLLGRFGQGGLPYEQANEVVLLHAPSYLRLFRGTDAANVETAGTRYGSFGAKWTHVAVAWSANASASPDGHGQLALYLDGRLVGNQTVCDRGGCDFGMAVQPGGVLHMGQEADAPFADFDHTQSFTGVVDELRMWDVVRSDAQLADSYRLGWSHDLGSSGGSTSLSEAMAHTVPSLPHHSVPSAH